MMLNLFALTSLFTGTISVLLLISGAVTALRYHHRLTLSEGHDERARLQGRIHLSLILVSTALILRLVSCLSFICFSRARHRSFRARCASTA